MKKSKQQSDDEAKQKGQSSKGRRGALRLARAARRRAYYAAQPMVTERNHKKRLGTYIRHFPEDLQARKRLEDMVGHTALDGHLANLAAKARKRQKSPQGSVRLAGLRGYESFAN